MLTFLEQTLHTVFPPSTFYFSSYFLLISLSLTMNVLLSSYFYSFAFSCKPFSFHHHLRQRQCLHFSSSSYQDTSFLFLLSLQILFNVLYACSLKFTSNAMHIHTFKFISTKHTSSSYLSEHNYLHTTFFFFISLRT